MNQESESWKENRQNILKLRQELANLRGKYETILNQWISDQIKPDKIQPEVFDEIVSQNKDFYEKLPKKLQKQYAKDLSLIDDYQKHLKSKFINQQEKISYLEDALMCDVLQLLYMIYTFYFKQQDLSQKLDDISNQKREKFQDKNQQKIQKMASRIQDKNIKIFDYKNQIIMLRQENEKLDQQIDALTQEAKDMEYGYRTQNDAKYKKHTIGDDNILKYSVGLNILQFVMILMMKSIGK